MRTVRRTTLFRIDAHDRVGERLRVDGHISRIGIQTYHDGIEERREYRDPVEVFDAASLDSMRGMPITVQHPRGLVTPRTWKRDAVGTVDSDVRQSEDGQHVAASLWVHEDSAIRKIESGELVELSVGYTAKLDMTPGSTPTGEHYDARQTEIRGNHVALLKAGQARGGSTVALRLDSQGDEIWHADDDGEGCRGAQPMKQTIRIDGTDYEVEAADTGLAKAVEIIVAARDEMKARADKADAERDAVKADADALQVKVDAAEKAEADRRREATIADAKRLAGEDLKIDDDDDEPKIRRAALEAKGVKLDEKDDQYVAFRFEHEVERIDADATERHDAIERSRKVIRIDREQITAEARAGASIDAGIRYIEGGN